MNKLSRPTLWLAIVFAAGIMLMPQRGAAKTIHDPWGGPKLGEPDDPPNVPSRVPVTLLPARWLVNSFVTRMRDLHESVASKPTTRYQRSRPR